ncbi:TonB-dependent receptor [Horticoccus sp. 23ND18S-11]|uniref:TonB-dependent receptor n=1 Tax=Horticoccus sp. 23ND18S-11 TaxID=3391832 RepID=UPI0039C9BA49
MTTEPAVPRGGRLAPLCFISSLLVAFVAMCLGLPATRAADAATGVVSGIVTNKTTGNGLIGAKVEIPKLNLGVLVDNTGRYLLTVPAGTHEIVVTYSGLDEQRMNITVNAGQPVLQNFVMSSAVLMLDAFKVASEKAGQASALTQQRNAENLKSVASMDALVDLPNMNATELAIRLPGVTFADPGDEVVEQISVRGMGAGTTSITIDGGGMSSFSAQNRNTRMTAFTGAMFESLELTKGQTPDRPVDSLGGSVNFKTRSPLSMSDKRRVVFNSQVRMAPWFTEQVPIREARRTHGLFNVQYTEKFAVFGADRENLAVSVNAFYSENAFGYFQTNRDYQQTNTQPAYLWDYAVRDNFNIRKQRSISSKWDYRLSQNDLLKLNIVVNNAPEPMRRQYNQRAYAGSATTVPGAATGIVPGAFDSRITVVRAVPTAANATFNTTAPALMDQQTSNINRDQRLRHADIGGEHKWGPIEADWAGLWSRTRYRYLGNEASLTNRIGNIPFVGPNGLAGSPTNNIVGPNGETGVGWILDRTQSDLYPRFIRNGGLDYTDPKNWRPSVNGLSTQSGNLDVDLIRELRGNVKYRVPFFEQYPSFLKAGYSVRDHNVELYRQNRRWSYIGKDNLPNDPSILTWDEVKTGRKLPYWDGAAFFNNSKLVNPALWQEDMYYFYQNRLAATVRTQELISGYYGQINGKIGRFGYLGGIRHEKTETVGRLNIRSRTLTTAAQQTADPLGSALKDYDNPTRNAGEYSENFPSMHTWYDLTSNLRLRAAWSTGMARPSLANAVSALSINETARTVTFGNPKLKPTKSKNWDFAAEYSFASTGYVKVGWFHKRIEDYVRANQPVGVVGTGLDNGFDGEYEGYEILANSNAGNAFTQGWEVEYSQSFRFLPGVLRTLRFSGNFTQIMAHGDYGTPGVYLTTENVNGFIPFTANANLGWDYKKFGVSVNYNYTAGSIRGAANIAQPSRDRYMVPRSVFNLNLRYNLPRNATVNFGVQNLFNEPQRYYRGIQDQMQTFLIQGTTMTLSVEGRF